MQNLKFQSPDVSHAMQIWNLVDETKHLDNNSQYIYALWCTYFRDHSAIALDGDEVLAFVTGFRCPSAPEIYFIWQTAAKPRHGVPNLGVELIQYAVEREVATGARVIEASVSARNAPIKMLFKTLCRRLQGKLETSLLFTGDMLSTGDGEHHDEILYRIELRAQPADAAAE